MHMDIKRGLRESRKAKAEPGSPVVPVSPDADQATSILERRLFLFLAAIALVFAFLSGLRTVAEPDLFWQLATGRWVAQHHQVFSTDVFSFTSAGQPWVYPVGSCLFFYGAYLLGGYVLLSWIGAAASVGTVALLLRKGSAVTAGLVILAVPIVARRTGPRAEMFTMILFAAYLSILWEYYRTGRGRLWILPPLMVIWVNSHLGFVAGIALIFAFAGMHVLDILRGDDRGRAAVQRLKRATPIFLAALLCTLVNPWGWKIYEAIVRQNSAMAEHSLWIVEWGRLPLSWVVLAKAFIPWSTNPFYLLLIVVVVSSIVAIVQREFGAAILLLCATYPAIQHIRMDCLSASVIVVVSGSILFRAAIRFRAWVPNNRTRLIAAACATVSIAAFAITQSVSAVKISEDSLATFGAGPSWWFPEQAVDFIERENPPGEIFNTYIQGGYLAWMLGPKRRDYIDGRAIPFGTQAFLRQAEMLQSSPDSAVWKAEEDRYNLNVIILPLNRFESVLGELKTYCGSKDWQVVYLDELAGVFVRRTAATEALIKRTNVDCATVPIGNTTFTGSAAGRFNRWADTASVLAALGRNSEALSAADQADQAFPGSAFVPWLRGNVYYMMGVRSDAERQYLTAISVNPNVPLFWFSLAVVYKYEGRIPETIAAQRKGIELSTMPQPAQLLKLARLYLETGQPKAALDTFDQVERAASPDLRAATGAYSLSFEVDQGRAAAWKALGDPKQSAAFDQKAVQDLVPRN